jgi:hypothetical protein
MSMPGINAAASSAGLPLIVAGRGFFQVIDLKRNKKTALCIQSQYEAHLPGEDRQFVNVSKE